MDAIGLNHLMFSTPDEVQQTIKMLGTDDPKVIATFVTTDPGLDAPRVRAQVDALAAKCRASGIHFDTRLVQRQGILLSVHPPGGG